MHVKLLEECLAVRRTLMATLWAGRARGAGEAERMSLDTFLQELEVDKRQPRGDRLGPAGKCACTVAGSGARDPLLSKLSQGPFILPCQND